MIASLKGTITHSTNDTIILDVNGVGYQVHAPLSFIAHLTQKVSIEPITVYIYTHVREDQLSLYGFKNLQDRDIFTKLISVSGIGPKIGLSILTQAPAKEIINAISTAKIEFFTKISGIGKKGAQKIILELKNQLGSLVELDLTDPSDTRPQLIAALTSLGYTTDEAHVLAKQVPPDITSLQEQIKAALKTKS